MMISTFDQFQSEIVASEGGGAAILQFYVQNWSSTILKSQ